MFWSTCSLLHAPQAVEQLQAGLARSERESAGRAGARCAHQREIEELTQDAVDYVSDPD